MTDFVNERRGDAAADHPLSRHADHGDRVVAAAWKACSRAPDSGAVPAVDVADDRWRVVVVRQLQRVGGKQIQTGQPDPRFVIAALRHHVREDVELGHQHVEPEADQRESPLQHRRRRTLLALPAEPRQEAVHHLAQPPGHLCQVVVDSGARVGRRCCCGNHRLEQQQWTHTIQSCQKRARLLIQQPSGERGGGIHAHSPTMTMVRPRRYHCPLVAPVAPMLPFGPG